MPSPYSEDLRLRGVQAVDSGNTTREIGAIFQVSPGFVSNLHQYGRQTGHVHSKPIGGYRRALLEPYEVMLKEPLSSNPSMPLTAWQAWLESEPGLSLSISAMDKFLRQQLGYRYKKNRCRQ
jgi:transposase